MRFAHITTGDRTAESLSLLGDAQVQTLKVLHTHAGAQAKGDESMARFGAHPGEVAQVDADQPPPEKPKVKTVPVQSKIDVLDHRVGGRDDKSIATPERRIIVRRGNQQAARLRAEIFFKRSDQRALADLGDRSASRGGGLKRGRPRLGCSRPPSTQYAHDRPERRGDRR